MIARLLGALACSTVVASLAAAQPANPLRNLDGYIEKARADWGVAGLAVSIVRNDSVIYAKGFGLKEAGKPDKVDERTLFAIGSNSKSFTAVALGMLQDEGKLHLDDKATKHLPAFNASDAYITRELTVRDLITHRSGYFRGDAVWMGSGFGRDEILRRTVNQPRSTSFRSTFGYNNIMFLAAGEIVGKVAGSSWDAFVRQRIFAPLGMNTSGTSVTELASQPNVATPHARVSGQPVAIKYRNIDNVGPAGSINSSVQEMAQYVRFHLGRGVYQGRELLSRRYHDDMVTPQTIAGTGRDTLLPMVHFDTYGLALWLRDYYGKKLVSHGGGIDGMLSQMAWIPEANVGVVVLTNTDGQNLQNALTFKVLDLLIGAPERDWSAIYLAQDRRNQRRADSARTAMVAERVAGSKASLALEKYLGRYEHAFYGELRVERDGDGLVLRRSAEQWATLEHWHFDTWRVEWNTSRTPGAMTFAMFKVEPNATVSTLEMRGAPFATPYEPGAVFRRVGTTGNAARAGGQ
ncbi:MAG: serine hydrolase [Gemmatimonadetes bacterium]|nr:serine hydrolase [Gemmatimonadota bacterium]